jgi:hypothetical protein
MDDPDSTNDQPPDLGPGKPTYPHLPQICRVANSALAGTSPPVYPAFVQQFVPPLSLRDREACFVVEPNSLPLGGGFYDCRLVGSYNGLPLFATTCCPAGGLSSSSSH